MGFENFEMKGRQPGGLHPMKTGRGRWVEGFMYYCLLLSHFSLCLHFLIPSLSISPSKGKENRGNPFSVSQRDLLKSRPHPSLHSYHLSFAFFFFFSCSQSVQDLEFFPPRSVNCYAPFNVHLLFLYTYILCKRCLQRYLEFMDELI